MTEMIKNSILSEVKGQLVGVDVLVYTRDKVEYAEHPQKIYLEFGNGKAFTVVCSSDGESIECRGGPSGLRPADMGEFGIEVVRDALRSPPWAGAEGQEIESAFEFRSNGKPIGMEFKFTGTEVYIFNLGDDLFVFDSFPSHSLDGQAIEIVKML